MTASGWAATFRRRLVNYYLCTAAEAFDVLHRGRAGSLHVHSRPEEDGVLVWDRKNQVLLKAFQV